MKPRRAPSPSAAEPRRAARGRPARPPTGESRSADAATTAWLLTGLMCLACELVALGVLGFLRWSPPGSEKLQVFAGLLLFSALALGTVLLGLTILVLKVRRARPPAALVRSGFVIAGVPWLAWLLDQLL